MCIRSLCLIIEAVLVFGPLLGAPVNAMSTESPSLATPSDLSGGLYCGVYSLYAALKAHGRDVNLEELLDSRYISSPFGSSLADLKRAADDQKMFTLAMRGMTAAMLRDAEHPIILHVRTARRGSPYRHWILFLGTKEGRAQVVDPPRAPEELSFADILSRWDGVGIVISNQKISTWRATRMGRLEQGITGMTSLMVILTTLGICLVFFPRRAKTIKTGLLGVLGSGIALGIAYHGLAADGFLKQADPVASVMTAHLAAHLAELSLDDLRAAMAGDNPVIIDARFARDYANGYIPTAVSIPISSTSSQRTRLLGAMPRDAKIIVYCQSETCAWSDELGSDLVFRGYKNVSVYRGGYREWSQAANQ